MRYRYTVELTVDELDFSATEGPYWHEQAAWRVVCTDAPACSAPGLLCCLLKNMPQAK